MITIEWTDGPANPKDWIGVYPEGVEPGSADVILWCYCDGNLGITGIANGTRTFPNGIATTGYYRVFLLSNDSSMVLSSGELFLVETATAN